MNGRRIVRWHKKPDQVGYVEQEEFERVTAESLQGLDMKMGIRRTCTIKELV